MRSLVRLVESRPFQRGVLVLILANAVLMGLETSRELTARHASLFGTLDVLVQVAFVAEIVLRLAAHGRAPWRFFRDGWNTFDFVVVAASLLPAAGPLATLARLARVLRAVRLVSALPELRLIVGTMLRSIPSLGHVAILLALLLYVYGVLGCHLFGDDAPANWGSLGAALKSLFQIVTLEGWVEMQREVLPSHPFAWVYFASFIVVAVFVVINLFIAVVINNLEATRREDQARGPEPDLVGRLEAMREEIASIEAELRRRG